MQTDEIEDYLTNRHTDGAALFREFRAKALAAGPDVTEKVSRTMVAWKRVRTFATAYVKGRYLEASIDLPDVVEHPHLRAAFKTSKAVTTHRFTLEKGESVDERMAAWLKHAYRTVGLGARAVGEQAPR